LPFEKYIVHCMKDVDLPLYLTVEDATYDLHPIVSGNDIFKKELQSHTPLRVKLNGPVSHWPSAEELQLDQSQFEAYHAALTQEFVLIQGPPGTGKTHVGLQIAKTLLHNKDAWQDRSSRHRCTFRNTQSKTKDQILVVCYTNHALDQFLEGIVKFLDGSNKRMWSDEIVRVGGRSENEAIQEFSLKNRRHHYHRPFYERQEQERKLDQLYNLINSQHRNISFLAYSLSHVNDTVLDVKLLIPVMREDHQQFFVVADKPEELFHWLEADKNAWLRRSERAYKNMSQLKTVSSSANTEVAIHTATNEENIEENEAKKVEDDRRIEDDDFSVRFKEQVGLDVRQQLMVVLNDIQSTQHLDKQFQSLVHREANATLARLKASDRMDANEVGNIRRSLKRLSVEQRWRLYRHWVYLYQQMQNEQLPELEKSYYETIADMKCCQPAQTFECEVIVDRELACGHSVQLKCHINTETYKCKIIVTRTLEACSHEADMQCWKNPDTHECRSVVNRILPSCGHETDMDCYRVPADVRCDKTITKSRDSCEHNYDVRCSDWNTSIDNFQGEENDIILLSLVRSNKDGKIGFLSRENRICVALSRAKKGLYVIGNFDMFESRNSRWADVVQKVKTAGQFGKALSLYCQNHLQAEGIQAEDASDFTKSPEGGCELKCDFRLCCGHACRLYCHPIDRMHTKYVCKQLCDKICQNEHICKRKCHFGENCECPITMCSRLCHEECDRPPCDQPCPQLLKCKHPCMGYCGDPCPSLCLVCEPVRWSEFDDEWNSFGDIRIVRLEECGHEPSARYLDKMFAKEDNNLSLLCCPICAKVIKWHPRYTNRLKKQWDNLAIAKKALALGSED
ncbi:NFX1-type zinc finger-containing protein 1-like, partial [Mizuhopecten yessoensis]|uniref:NFX1-type zinc finger-containing protein 1-like n=1 Tax=Mizuhopecten yessoensis TaxID=6573 RepID=UPI000B45B95A